MLETGRGLTQQNLIFLIYLSKPNPDCALSARPQNVIPSTACQWFACKPLLGSGRLRLDSDAVSANIERPFSTND